jgi:hypothetical protein
VDDQTERLRDIFMDVSDEETVTESQAEQRGSLTDDDGEPDERLRAVVEKLRDAEDFRTDFEGAAYVAVVRRFYDGDEDDAVADALGWTPEDVFRARMDLHLVRDADADGVDLGALRQRRKEDNAALAEDLDIDAGTIERVRRVAAAEDAARAANHRYRTEFEEILTDADLAGEYASGVHEDGLEEAAEDIETDVSF